MKKFVVVFLVSLFFASIAYAADSATSTSGWPTPVQTAAKNLGAKKYFCPMDGFVSDKPGKCKKCGMELIEEEVHTSTTATVVPKT